MLNCSEQMLKELEPWCSTIYIEDTDIIKKYVEEEQKNTKFDLVKRIKTIHKKDGNKNVLDNCVTISFDATRLNSENFQILVNLSDILTDSGETGEMELDIFKFHIKSLETYEKELISVS